jgi:cytochrome o ubiquinol oxidase subunit II
LWKERRDWEVFFQAAIFFWQSSGITEKHPNVFSLAMIDPLITLAVAESFLQPMGPVAAEQLRHLQFVTFLTLIAVVPVLVATPWILWRYRRSKPTGKYRPNWESSPILEWLMWGVPILVVALMGVSLWHMTFRLDPYKELGKDPLQIKVIGLDWKWIFIYPDEGVALVDELIVPEGRAVELTLTTDTVMQSLRISAIVGQIYAMPAMTTKLNFIAAAQGEARGMNTQFTGNGFWKQHFPVYSVSEEEYAARMKQAQSSELELTADTYAILAMQGTSEEAKKPLGIENQKGPIAMVLGDPNIFQRVLARYMLEDMTPESQPGSPFYNPKKSPLPPASDKPMMGMEM